MKRISRIVKKNETLILPYFWVDDEDSDVILEIRLAGEGASATIVAGFLGSKKSIVFNTKVIHEAPKTKSFTLLRGVFRNTSIFENDGLVKIAKGAVGSDGYFASKILLFDNAKGKSIPSLEIDENDLKAGHASTVGRPDAEQIFYLRSRGLSEKEAVELIVTGFFRPLLPYLSPKDVSFAVKKFGISSL